AHLHLLPIIMGGGMFFQQRLSGAVTDPTQKQMMIMMPVMMTVMFYGMPSGLVLYWLTNSVMTMCFQWVFTRTHRDQTDVIDTTIVK
ncbi:MAG TPA: YidC/Oxa1 family membrane protein insertase, partial [Elusimicrobiota bacterium]|nr:YidC/Oxa1 family membrane protein insertase [Elusimicrobiota bacterium]